ncbi:MAG: amidohydrolase [Flavobacterium sp.]|nr:amidohydrolase [Pedobacter sp.]
MKPLSLLVLGIVLSSCNVHEQADLVVYNAHVYTVDNSFSVAEAFAVREGKIIETGSSESIRKKFKADKNLNASGKWIYPGLIDGHSHFYRYGEGLQSVDLVGTHSWNEVIEKVKIFAGKNKAGWIIGRGWDQNDWDKKDFPDNEELNILFPNQPVFLSRVDGHAAIVNAKAMQLAAIQPGQKLTGGDIKILNGKLTGLLIDNAVDLVFAKIPVSTPVQQKQALLDAQKNCFKVGLTTVVDCGLDYPMIKVIDNLQKANQLKMRMYVMLSDNASNLNYLFKNGIFKTERLNVRSFKVYADGALGSRGACLLQPYTDQPSNSGFLLSEKKHFAEVAQKIAAKGFQMNTHAIGDSANREILNVYKKVLKGKNDLRWRIEHAQVINPVDFKLFGQNSIIPSVQSTHATSDMYWAKNRLGNDRVKGAYAYKQLLDQNGWIVLGTDFPIEDIDPIKTFYAAVIRKDLKGFPANGYQMENALGREQALRGMTIWAAKGSFEETEKGSLEVGKFADFILLDKDIMKVKPEDLINTKVLKTYVNGELVFAK